MNLELSWTDECFLIVLLLSFFAIIRSTRKPHIRAAFLSIFHKPVAASAFIILMFFLVIGVLDSFHFSMGTGPSGSLLDKLLAPLGEQYEQTYSAPLSLRSYSSETVLIQGQAEQIYPRLIYPSHFASNAEKRVWIIRVLAITALSCLGVMLLFYVVGQSLRRFKPTNHPLPNHVLWSMGVTLFICLYCTVSGYWLSRALHIFGTGQIGQDIFYYSIKSIRTGLVIGILTTLFMMPLALFAGVSAGYFGGVIDDIIQYIYTTLNSIPGVLLITASVLSMQTYIANHPQQFATLAQSADARLLALCLILGVTSWTSLCRLLRAEALKLREIDFVLAAQALGSSSFRIIVKHLLPNVMHIVIITLVLDFSFLVLAEAVLSYVGVGVSPMTISWGNMINAARLELAREPIVWWPMTAAFALMFTLVLASNLFADAVRDAFDPHGH